MAVEKYAAQIAALLPRGPAWIAAFEGTTTFRRLCLGLAEEFARIDARAKDCLRETFPRTTFELLPEWEQLTAQTPQSGDTTSDRQSRVASHIAVAPRQDVPYYLSLFNAYGLTPTVVSFRPFLAGTSTAGESCADQSWKFVCEFRLSVAGPLPKLEQTILKMKPAHVAFRFRYSNS